jgi:hypothetical protein
LQTLKEAKEWLRTKAEKGERCPCCTQLVKVYERKIYSTMAASLVYFYSHFSHDEFHHYSKWNAKFHKGGGGDFSKLQYWGLVEEMPIKEKEDKRTSGYWRITNKGKSFVIGAITVPSHVRIYDGRLLGFKGKEVSIKECLGTRFSYAELFQNLN